YPPQKGGGGISPEPNRAAVVAYRASSSARLPTTCDCGDAQAAIWLPRGRAAKYAAVSESAIRSTGPSARTCRRAGCQWTAMAARGLAASSAALRLSWLVKKTKPRTSWPLSRTIRTEGALSALAVASAIASGCASPDASASAYQRANCRNG